jgi:hypothetical protein
MANSHIWWVDVTFDWAVHALVRLGQVLVISYEEITSGCSASHGPW